MKRHYLFTALLLAGGLCCAAFADEDQTTPAPDGGDAALVEEADSNIAQDRTVSAELQPFDRVVPEATKLGGPISTYRKKDNLYWELTSSQYGVDYICVVSIARGIGTPDLYGGQAIDYGNDMIWRFKKVDDRVQLIRRNYRYRADDGPDAEALKVAFTDSVIFSLPIIATGPGGGDVVDVTSLFMGDSISNVGSRYVGGSFARDRSSWEKVKALKDNLELEVAATYSVGRGSSETVVDLRGVTVNVHYSISKLKTDGYKPRLADERVGYFNSAVRDVSNKKADDNFIRYINRWNLQKLEPDAEISLPKKPIVYWLDKATPYEYRKTLRDGVLEWNKAFEKAGFYNAIEVRQQEDNDEWDAEDINYNVIRWSSTDTGFSIGPSRVNPETGQILDADVVLSVCFLSGWTRQFDTYDPNQLLEKFTGRNFTDETRAQKLFEENSTHCACSLNKDLFYSQQFGLASTFFDVMTVETLDAIEADTAVETVADADASSQDDSAADSDKAQIDAAREVADKANDAANKASELAKQASEELAKVNEQIAKANEADEATRKQFEESRAALEKKAQDALDVANNAKSVADDAAKRLAEVEKFVEELKAARKAADEKKVAEDKANADKAAKADKEKAVKEAKERIAKEREKVIEQGLRQVVAHEVGHTLGLRHNFVQSCLHTLDEINDASKWTEHGFVGSVMEYAPINIMPKGEKQGEYYSYRLGEYDEWVIEYGYRVFPGKTTQTEKAELEKIASKQSLPEHKFSTDEDCYGTTVNPYVNVWDLGASPLEYAKVRVRLVDQLLPGLNDRIVEDGESYAKMRARFNMLNNWKVNGMVFAANYIGGLIVNRDFKGDENGQKPFQVVPAKDQRDAMDFLAENCFGVNAYKIPSELYDYLAPNRWHHWGSNIPSRYDYDVHANLLAMQNNILSQLLSNSTLGRLADAELRVKEGEDVFTSAELLQKLDAAINQEINDAVKALKDNKEGKVEVKIASNRRNIQRSFLDRLVDAANGGGSNAGAADVSALSRMILKNRAADLELILNSDRVEFKNANGRGDDPFARAYLLDCQEKIKQTLEAVRTVGGGSSGAIILSL